MTTLQMQATTLKAKLFRGFADPSRLSILEALREGPLTVSAIVEKTGLSRTNISNHLRCLSDCDLVTSEPQGRYTLYQLSHPKIASLFAVAEEILRDIARGVYECTNYTEEHPAFVAKGANDEHDHS
ncbi:MAG TPA: metalloregulator ArsR/SmtB family transcription factor [Ktedonobacteraceae bacterium]|nr:metalloregulator ArsR/SmtB family transcription factor [Ktedonobacteraceae bacterium]